MSTNPPPRPTIRSVQPCPVCGGREWVPLVLFGGELDDYDFRCTTVGCTVDLTGGNFAWDECATCGTVCV